MPKTIHSSFNASHSNDCKENDDTRIIQEVLSGNIDAFAAFVEKYEIMVYNLAFYKLGNHEDAQDLTQECFFRIYKTLEKYNGRKAAFSTWIYIICRNLIYDFQKSRKNKKEVPFYFSADAAEPEAYKIADYSNEPSEIMIRKERVEKIRELIWTLPENQREIIVMRDINGLSYIEIAKILDIKPGVLKKQIYTARQKLKKYILTDGYNF
jgi:RNA polymerase sigma-70 factor (ECF subfamily)